MSTPPPESEDVEQPFVEHLIELRDRLIKSAWGVALAFASIIGSLYIAAGLARRAVTAAVHWSAGRPGRRFLAFLAVAACAVPLTLFWLFDGQLSDW